MLATLTAAAVAASSSGVWAADVDGQLVAERPTSSWTPPSSDPSGITFIPSKGLLISDAEVEETPPMGLGQPTNLFLSTLDGTKMAEGSTTAWSKEPTGVFYVAAPGSPWNEHLFVTDDDRKEVFDITSAGADGQFGTADDGSRTSFKTAQYGNTDPEDVALDWKNNELWIAGGLSHVVTRLNPGADNNFNTPADNVAYTYTVPQLDATNLPSPEGMAYDPQRQTIYVLEGEANVIFELARNGAVLNAIHLDDVDIQNAGGIALDPASTGASRTFYLADRGLDPNGSRLPAQFNDGVVHEVRVTLPAITNRSPMADAGVDQIVDTDQTVTLTGVGTDSDPADTLTYKWTGSGGPVVPQIANATTPTATVTGLTTPGAYTFTLTVSDGKASHSDQVTVTAYGPGAPRSTTVTMVTGLDDAMEGENGGALFVNPLFVDVASAVDELGSGATTAGAQYPVLTGLRFPRIPVPKGAQIVNAQVKFTSSEASTAATNLTIVGENVDNAPQYVPGRGGLTARYLQKTTQSVGWQPPAWGVPGTSGTAETTPNLATILQAIVDRPGWQQDNAAAFMISGTGRRTAYSKDGLTPPLLLLEYKTVAAPANTAPVVNAGADATAKVGRALNLAGTVTDDGQPTPVTLTTRWTQLSGPQGGKATFADPAAKATTVTFSAPGSYGLELSATDGALTGADTVTITVAPADAPPPPPPPGGGSGGGGTANLAPIVDAGGNLTVSMPSAASLDASVTDDGLPTGTLTTAWSKVAGPGEVTFGDSGKVDTVATFSDAGTYVLRLTANDSALSSHDDVRVTVRAGTLPVLVQSLSATTSDSLVPVGKKISIKGFAIPAVDGQELQLQRWSKGWHTVATKTLPAGDKVGYNFVIDSERSGRFRYRVVLVAQDGATGDVAPNNRVGLVVIVYEALIKRVNFRSDVVVVRNVGKVPFSIENWMLVSRRLGVSTLLPSYTIRPGRAVRIDSGEGRSTRNLLFLGAGEMWARHGVAVLRDAWLRLADRRRF